MFGRLLAVIMVFASSCALGESTGREGAPPFPLMAWGPPPATQAAFERYAAAHLNMIPIKADANAESRIALARAAALRVMLTGRDGRGIYAEEKSVWGKAHGVDAVLIAESCSLEQTDMVAEKAQAPRSTHGATLSFLTPTSPRDGQWKAMAEHLAHRGPTALCFERFTLLADGRTDEDSMYDYLEFALDAARTSGADVWGFVQVTAHGPFRFASESDIRFQVYSQLAYGARGLCYHRYHHDEPNTGEAERMTQSMVNPRTGKTLYLWEKVDEVNREVLALGPCLLDLLPEKVYFVGEVPENREALPFGKTPIKTATAEKALLAFFHDIENRDWVLVVNRRHGMRRSSASTQSSVRLVPEDRVTRVVEIDRISGKEVPVSLSKDGCVLEIPGGTGCLLRLDTGAG